MERMQRRSISCLPKGTTRQRSMNTSIESVPSARRIRNLSARIPQQRVRTWTGLAWMACPSSSSSRTTECGEVHLRDAMFREAVADGQGPRGRDVNFLLKLSAEFELQCADILGPKINLGTKKKADEEPERLRDFSLLAYSFNLDPTMRLVVGTWLLYYTYIHCCSTANYTARIAYQHYYHLYYYLKLFPLLPSSLLLVVLSIPALSVIDSYLMVRIILVSHTNYLHSNPMRS